MFMLSWSSGQDVALSRRNQGFDSPREYQYQQKRVLKQMFQNSFFNQDFLKLLKICSAVFAERAYEIVRQFIAFVYISAYLAYPAF